MTNTYADDAHMTDKELCDLETICSDSYERMSMRDKKEYLKEIITHYGFKTNA